MLLINNQRNGKKQEDLVDGAIRFKEVRLIDQNGEQRGIVSSRDAQRMAYDADLNLVCVSPNAKPPVCKIMDYGKYRYEQQRKAREAKKNQKVVTTKEIRLKPMIDKHDLETKINRGIGFLEKGDKVKVTLRLYGRLIAHKELANELITKVIEMTKEHATVEQRKRSDDGRQIFVLLAPISK